jgi:hypothetical protein
MNEYGFEIIVRDRLAALRAEAERRDRVGVDRPASRPLRGAMRSVLTQVRARFLGLPGRTVDGAAPIQTFQEGRRHARASGALRHVRRCAER